MQSNERNETTTVDVRLYALELALKAALNQLADTSRDPAKTWRQTKDRAATELAEQMAEYPTASTSSAIDPCSTCGNPTDGTNRVCISENGVHTFWHSGCHGKMRREELEPIRQAIEDLFRSRRPAWKSPFDS